MRVWPLLVVVAVVLIAINLMLQYHANSVSMRRYCDFPDDVVEYVRQLETNQPIQMDKNRRAALVSAKPIFLVPRQHDEPLEMYLGRVKEQFTLRCQGVAG